MTSVRHLWSSRRAIFGLACIVVIVLYIASGLALPFSPGPAVFRGLGFKPDVPFEIGSAVWADGGPAPITVDLTFPSALPPERWGMRVPNVVHYIMLARPGGSAEMDYRQYLAVRSALVVQNPRAIYIHYDMIPSGIWWDQLVLEPSLMLNHVDVPTTIWDRPLDLAAHRSDIIRLYALKAMGGVYLDLDVFVLRPLNDLFYEPFTMGLENEEMTKMGNAVIVSAPGAGFIDRWMMGYQDFRPQHYAYNGVVKPLEIAKSHPEDLRLLNATAFFYPQWWHNDLVFKSTGFDWESHNGYTYHAWGSLHDHLKNLTPERVLEVDTSFHRLIRRYMGERDLEIWKGVTIGG